MHSVVVSTSVCHHEDAGSFPRRFNILLSFHGGAGVLCWPLCQSSRTQRSALGGGERRDGGPDGVGREWARVPSALSAPMSTGGGMRGGQTRLEPRQGLSLRTLPEPQSDNDMVGQVYISTRTR